MEVILVIFLLLLAVSAIDNEVVIRDKNTKKETNLTSQLKNIINKIKKKF